MVRYNVGILFYNANAGKEETNVVEEIKSLLNHMVSDLKVYETKKSGDIEKKCSNLENAEIVFIMGGDGSLHELVNGFYKYNIDLPIGLIPSGTFNDFSYTLNIPPKPVEAVQALYNSIPVKYDAILNNNRVALNFWTIGLSVYNAQTVENEKKRNTGKKSYLHIGYLSKIIKYFFNPEVFKYKIEIDGQKLTGKSIMIVVANGTRIGSIPIPLEDISACDGYFNIFIVESKGIKILTDLLGNKNMVNWNKLSNFVKQYPAQEINIIHPKNKNIDTDGEIYQFTPSKLKILPERFTLLTVKS